MMQQSAKVQHRASAAHFYWDSYQINSNIEFDVRVEYVDDKLLILENGWNPVRTTRTIEYLGRLNEVPCLAWGTEVSFAGRDGVPSASDCAYEAEVSIYLNRCPISLEGDDEHDGSRLRFVSVRLDIWS